MPDGRNGGGVSLAKGYDPRRGHGKKGRSGAPSEKFRALCRTLADDPQTLKQVKRVLADGDHPQFTRLWQTVAEFGHGKALQAIDLGEHVPEIRVVFE